jgi:transcription elongation factor GreA
MKFYMTRNGMNLLKMYIKELRVERIKKGKEVGNAAEFGDLRENAEFDASIEMYTRLGKELHYLEKKMGNTKVIDIPKKPITCCLGSKITVYNNILKKEEIYRIVGDLESDLLIKHFPSLEGFISYQSPIAKSLIGKSIGDSVIVNAPNSQYELNIKNIESLLEK